MYEGFPPSHSFRRPSSLQRGRDALEKPPLIGIFYKENQILIPPRSMSLWSCLEENRNKGTPEYSDFQHPQQALPRQILKIVRELGIQKSTSIVILDHYEGPLVLDTQYAEPILVDAQMPYHVKHRVFGGIYIEQARRAHETDVKFYEWWLSRIANLKEPEPTFDEGKERKIARMIRRELTDELATYLSDQSKGGELNVFPYTSLGGNCSHDSNIMVKAIKKAVDSGAKVNCRMKDNGYVENVDRLSLNSPLALERFKQYLSFQILNKELNTTAKEQSIGKQFYFMTDTKGCVFSRTLCPFYHEEEDERNCCKDWIKETLLDSCERRVTNVDLAVNALKKYGIPFQMTDQGLVSDKFNFFVPTVEYYQLVIMRMHGFIQPFEFGGEKRRDFDVEAADMYAPQFKGRPCAIDILCSRHGLKSVTGPMKVGSACHAITYEDPGTMNYVGYDIYGLKLWGIAPVRRERFCEQTHYTDFHGYICKFTPDALLDLNGKIVVTDMKLGTPPRYGYGLDYAAQEAFQAIMCSSMGHETAGFGYIIYVKGPNVQSKTEVYKPEYRKVTYTNNLVEATKESILSVAEETSRISSHPEMLDDIFVDHVKGGCQSCSNNSLEKMYKLKEMLYSGNSGSKA